MNAAVRRLPVDLGHEDCFVGEGQTKEDDEVDGAAQRLAVPIG